MDINIIKDLVYKGKISNLRCDKTKKLILAYEPYYFLCGEILNGKDSPNEMVRQLTNNFYEDFEVANADNEEDYYWSENYGNEDIIFEICYGGYFYKEDGEEVTFEKIKLKF